jgi:membrane protein
MKLHRAVAQRVQNLLTTPLTELAGWARFARIQIHMWRHCMRRLHEHNVMAMSAALSFRTIFALIPMIIVAFLVLKSMGAVEDSKRLLRNVLEKTGMTQITFPDESLTAEYFPPQEGAAPAPPADGAEAAEAAEAARISVAERIESLVERVEGQLTIGRLGPIGAALLIWSALTLLITVERCINRIFEVRRERSLARRVLLYWTAVTLGPLVLVAVSESAKKAMEAASGIPVLSVFVHVLGYAGPVLVGILLLAALYMLMPNTPVRFRSAIEGAVIAVPIWLVLKFGFNMYVQHAGKTSLYGAIALVPLFLMWLNLSWLTFLFGAEVAHTADNLSRFMEDEEIGAAITPYHHLSGALAVAQAQARGGPVSADDVAAAMRVAPRTALRVLATLSEGGVICRVAGPDEPRYVLARPASALPLPRILHMTPPGTSAAAQEAADLGIAGAVRDVRRKAEAGLDGLTLEDLLHRVNSEGKSS